MLKLLLLNQYIKKKADLIKAIMNQLMLNGFSKIYKRFINDKLLIHVNGILSDFVSAYRSKYSSNNMILSLTEGWKEKLDKEFFAEAVLLGLIKGV